MTINSALIALQAKCNVLKTGKWDQSTFKGAVNYFKLSKDRAAHFFGQCDHESGNFTVFSENLNYSDTGLVGVFHKYFPTIASTAGYAHNPVRIANRVYSNRMGNGDEASGDGYKFRGRGPIQMTGKYMYQKFATHINRPDIMVNPDLVSTELAFESAMFFFELNGLWAICDEGINTTTITAITKHINGGINGLSDRIAKTELFASWL